MNRSILRARFASVCLVCSKPIVPGEEISMERSPKAKHWSCSYKETPATVEPIPPSKWEQFEGKVVVIADRWENHMVGKVKRLNEQPFGSDQGRRGWYVLLNTTSYGRLRSYYRELKDSDVVVDQYRVELAVAK